MISSADLLQDESSHGPLHRALGPLAVTRRSPGVGRRVAMQPVSRVSTGGRPAEASTQWR